MVNRKSAWFIGAMGMVVSVYILFKVLEDNNSIEEKQAATKNSGEVAYQKHCATCHQYDGNGVPGMYPPISGTKVVNGNKEQLIEIILYGLSGEIVVKDQVYNNEMAPHDYLGNAEIARLLTYIRSNFGNDSGPVTEQDVQRVRAKNN
jgi:mono/diheme cytochrome c family protein